MREIELSKRLNKVTEYVIEGEPILDIGSDHAYLPLYLVKNKITPLAIAGEVVKGPYEKAKKEVIRHELTDKISVRLGSGFDVLESEELIPNIFICGMGGILISEIIEKGMEDNKISSKSRLILQANNKEKELRDFLVAFNFKIISESLIKENNKFYEIIVAEKSKSKMHYSQEELFFGPVLLKVRSQEFKGKWQNVLEKNKMILEKLNEKEHQNKIEELKEINQKIEKVIF